MNETLHQAAKEGVLARAQALLEADTNVNSQTNDGQTAVEVTRENGKNRTANTICAFVCHNE